MSYRTTNLLLTVLGTLLLLLTSVWVLLIPIFVGFNAVAAKPGSGIAGRLILGSLGLLLLAGACAAGAWALRRVIKRREAAGRQ
jgi:hypothetical protein